MTLAITYPLTVTRNRMAIDTFEPRRFPNGKIFYSYAAENTGLLSLYRGFGVALLGMTVYRGMYFGFFEHGKSFITYDSSKSARMMLA